VASNEAVDSISSCSSSSTIAVGNGVTLQHVGMLKHENKVLDSSSVHMLGTFAEASTAMQSQGF
jgi:hypothetical protein